MLRIRGLRKAYGNTEVLRGVDLSAEAGEIVGLLGPNGAGKTTLVSIVAGLRGADGGTVEVGGIDALAKSAKARELIGLGPQDLGIYPVLSVRQNIEFFAGLAGMGGRELRTCVSSIAEELELEPLLRQRAGTLSGGQKRRLHTAMALVGRPALLFLDEPTVGADVATRSRILEVVRRRAEAGCAVVYTSHYLPEIEALGATVAVLKGGRIVARGSIESLVARYGSPSLRLSFDGAAPTLDGFTIVGSVATLETPDPAGAAAAAMTRLNVSAARLRAVDIVRPGLEAAYLALTGRRPNHHVDSIEEDSDELVA